MHGTFGKPATSPLHSSILLALVNSALQHNNLGTSALFIVAARHAGVRPKPDTIQWTHNHRKAADIKKPDIVVRKRPKAQKRPFNCPKRIPA